MCAFYLYTLYNEIGISYLSFLLHVVYLKFRKYNIYGLLTGISKKFRHIHYVV